MNTADAPLLQSVGPDFEPCRHPFLRSTTGLVDARPVFRCECGAIVPCRDKFDEKVWFGRRVGEIARAIRDGDLGEADRLAEEA